MEDQFLRIASALAYAAIVWRFGDKISVDNPLGAVLGAFFYISSIFAIFEAFITLLSMFF